VEYYSSPHLRADGGEGLVAEDELPGTVEGFSLPLWKKPQKSITHKIGRRCDQARRN